MPLPFQYYQHAMGMTETLPPAFKKLFYSDTEARAAYKLLETVMDDLSDEYHTTNNYVEEYGLFLKKMGKRVGE